MTHSGAAGDARQPGRFTATTAGWHHITSRATIARWLTIWTPAQPGDNPGQLAPGEDDVAEEPA